MMWDNLPYDQDAAAKHGYTYVRCAGCHKFFIMDIKELASQDLPHYDPVISFVCNGPYIII